jgi:hypothetical protein
MNQEVGDKVSRWAKAKPEMMISIVKVEIMVVDGNSIAFGSFFCGDAFMSNHR